MRSTIGQRAKRVLPNSARVPNLDNAAGIKQSKKVRNLLKLNSIKAKLNQTATVANYRPQTHTTRRYISDRIRKNMPAVDSKTVPVARSVLTTPLARRENPPRKHVTGTSPAGGHVNTEHSSKPKQLNKHSQ